MHKRRLIAVLFLKDGWIVRSENFTLIQFIGDPVAHVERMVQWNVDELIVLDIGQDESRFDHARMDYRHKPVTNVLEFIERAGVQCNIPLTFGGRIRSIGDIALRIQNGADKVAINTLLHENPSIVTAAAHSFGSQAIVASIDYRGEGAETKVFVGRGKIPVEADIVSWARHAEALGAGEILLNAMDRDGRADGFDLEGIARVSQSVSIPIIACGGAGMNQHFLDVLNTTEASAVAAGNIFHFKENAYPNAKIFLREHIEDIR